MTASLPPGLDTVPPGPFLAALLASVDVTAVSPDDRIVLLRAHQRMASHYQAHLYADMASVVDAFEDLVEPGDDAGWAADAAAAEIRVALRLTRRSADREMEVAIDVARHYPTIGKALATGRIDVHRAKVLVDGTAHLPTGIAGEVLERVIGEAPGLTTGQLRALLRRQCIDTDPDEARCRYEDTLNSRRVVAEPTVDGTAHLFALDLAPDRVAAITRRLTYLAKSRRVPGDTRTMDQRRADAFVDLLIGSNESMDGAGSGRGGVIDIRVDLDTLGELADHSGELAGYGPVIADIARRVARDQTRAEWRYTVTDPATGRPLHTGITRRRPTASQRRTVESHDPVCVFPGCRNPATDSDLDHRIPWADGGPTDEEHLAPLCRHDHMVRHGAGWAYSPLPGGDHLWTTTLGHIYTTSGAPP